MAQTSRYSNLIVSAQLKDDWDGTIYLIDSGQVGKTGGWGGGAAAFKRACSESSSGIW